jgi:hypothetical protein
MGDASGVSASLQHRGIARQQWLAGIGLQRINVETVHALLIIVGADEVEDKILDELNVFEAFGRIVPAIDLKIGS